LAIYVAIHLLKFGYNDTTDDVYGAVMITA